MGSFTFVNLLQKAWFTAVKMGTNHLGEISSLMVLAKLDLGFLTQLSAVHIGFFLDLSRILLEKKFYLPSNLRGALPPYSFLQRSVPVGGELGCQSWVAFGFHEERDFS